MASIAGKDLRSFYYPANFPDSPYVVPKSKTASFSGSIYLDQEYTKTVGGASTPLTDAQIPLIGSTGVDNITGKTSSATSSSAVASNNSFGFKVFAAPSGSSLVTPELQLNTGNDSISGTALLSRVNNVTISAGTFKRPVYYYLVGVQNDGNIYGGLLQGDVQLPGSGNDTVTGTGNYNGFANGLGALLDLGDGNDKLTGTGGKLIVGSSGVFNEGVIVMGVDTLDTSIKGNSDNDTVSATSSYTGFYNSLSATFLAGTGNDTITAKGGTLFDGQTGLFNAGLISMGAGNDAITASGFTAIYNSGTLGMGDGVDRITASGSQFGIFNDIGGRILFGSSGSTLTASGVISGVKNNGTIEFAGGKNTVNITKGGISGDLNPLDGDNPYGLWSFGEGADTLTGFGTGFFNGGEVISNTLNLPRNTSYYVEEVTIENSIDPAKDGNWLSFTGIEGAVGKMLVANFQTINKKTIGSLPTGTAFIYTISSSGVGTASLVPEDWVPFSA
jgi:hypothetical protein